MSNKYPRIAIVDLEATGPNIEDGDEIIQLAALIIENNQVVEEHSQTINPGRSIPEPIQKLTGITDQDVAGCPSFEEIAKEWYDLLYDCYFVAHNTAFDLKVLQEEFAKYHLTFNPKSIDTVKLSKIFLPEAKGFNLMELSMELGIPFTDAHQAIEDARMTRYLITELAQRCLNLEPTERSILQSITQKIDFGTSFFVSEPEHFIIKPNLEVTQLPELEPTESLDIIHHDALLSSKVDYILNQWNQNPHSILEDPIRPIDTATMMTLIERMLEHQATIIVTEQESTQLKIKMIACHQQCNVVHLRHPRRYLCREQLIKLVHLLDQIKINSHDLTIVAATYYWQTTRTILDLTTLNQELDIVGVLQRYHKSESSIFSNSYYDAIEKAKKADIIMMTPVDFHYLFSSPSDLYESFMDRSVIILDAFDYFNSISDYSELKLPISEGLTLWSRWLHLFSEAGLDYSYQLLDQLIQSGYQLTDSLIRVLKQFDSSSKQQESVSLTINGSDNLAEKIHQTVQRMVRIVNELIQLDSLSIIDQDANEVINQWQQRLTGFIMKDSNQLLYLTATRIRNEFYRLVLRKKPLILQSNYLKYLNQFNQVLLISLGGYQDYQQQWGYHRWVDLDGFDYLKLPLSFYPPGVRVSLPIEYLARVQDIERMEDLAEYMSKHLMDHATIIIIVSNKQQAKSLYHILMDRPSLDSYLIQAQSVTSNRHKIRRRMIEQDKNIIILTRKGFLSEEWQQFNHEGVIILFNLPFVAMNHVWLQGQISLFNAQHPNQNYDNFKAVQLPQMILNMKRLLMRFNEDYPEYAIYLWDQRIMTKEYSQTVFAQLNKLAQFEIE